jgi:WD40-like Beta Propeller Repeat
VLSQEDDSAGILQVYRSRLDGSEMHCLTCHAVPGPNGFPQERSQGDWILFCSYGDQPEHYGNPCLGGYGGDLYVMRPNGTAVTRLTQSSDPGDGADFDVPGGVPYDNYHAYWSPDGRHLVWTRTEAFPLSEGGQRWEIMAADFVSPKHGKPHLANVRVVGPAYGVYETQHWAPDGSGFLFTAFGPRESPYQSTPPGWMNQQLYFMRLYGRGASPAHPRVTQLSDNLPVYEEQAAFTPDMRDVIFMTNRNTPIGSWYDEVIAAAQRTGFDAPDPGSTGTVQFLADFSDPNFRSDLYMLDVRTHDLRELTDFHNVMPEFNWNRNHTKLLWSGIVGGSDHDFITRVGSFPTITAKQRRSRRRIPAPGLYGQPIDMSRVTASRPARATVATAGKNVPQTGRDKQTLPTVVATYYALWLQQLKALGAAAGIDIGNPSFLTSSGG